MEQTAHETASETQRLVEGLAEDACLSLFDAYGVQLRASDKVHTAREQTLTGIIGFTGPGITGMCLMACSEEPISASIPTGGALRDWVAELSNQLAGRLKHKLLAKGVEVYITTPIVLKATRIEPLPRGGLVPRGFEALNGMVSLWVEVDTSPEFQIAEVVELPVEEGEALLF